ncbi:MAG: flagellar export protein FliJ [Phycisphaerae bacterium]|jgi:flagellar FliJ protein|nr:flagellar export protein FliJ [Phycisphaerae bacterium]
MARFRFQLQALLDARKRAEDVRRREVAELEGERNRLENDLRRRQASIVNAREEARDGLVGEVRPHLLRAAANASMSLMRDAQRSVLELAGLHRRLDAARAVLAEASRDRRAIELVRERRYEAWKMEIERREQSALDEIATNAGARRAREREAVEDGVRETA